MSHKNNGNCDHCDLIFDKYPGFHPGVRKWFKLFQLEHPEAHISCAGRGRIDQETCFARGASKAKFGQSSHNYNAAIDLFCELPGSKDLWDLHWFETVLAPNIPSWIKWYGIKGSPFYELPHLELRDWRDLVDRSALSLIES